MASATGVLADGRLLLLTQGVGIEGITPRPSYGADALCGAHPTIQAT